MCEVSLFQYFCYFYRAEGRAEIDRNHWTRKEIENTLLFMHLHFIYFTFVQFFLAE